MVINPGPAIPDSGNEAVFRLENMALLSRDEINSADWDQCVESSVSAIIYALSAYLDCVAPGNWQGLVYTDEITGKYLAVMPVCINRRRIVPVIFQPFFTQQSGVFYRGTITGYFATQLERAFVLRLFSIAKAGEYAFREHFVFQEIIGSPNFKLRHGVTHLLEFNRALPEVSKVYNENLKRNLKRASKAGLYPEFISNSNEAPGAINKTLLNRLNTPINEATLRLIALFKATRGKLLPEIKERHYNSLLRIAQTFIPLNMAFIAEAYVPGNAGPIASALFLKSFDRLIFLFSATSDSAKNLGAMHFLLHSIVSNLGAQTGLNDQDFIPGIPSFRIVDNTFKPKYLDFEGGSDEGTGRFYRSFGAEPVEYPIISFNGYPKPFNRLAGIR
ncbi:MAG: hypothetical protein V4543_12670 [Bacteroidota bacterium]